MKKRFLNKCTGRKITFKTLKESKPATPTATTQILPPASADSDSDSEYLTEVFSGMKSQEPEFGFRHCVAGFSTDRVVNEETVPIYEELMKTADIADKACLICQKGGMLLSKLSQHLQQYHDIFFFGEEFDHSISDWIATAKDWDDENRVYSDSENEISGTLMTNILRLNLLPASLPPGSM